VRVFSPVRFRITNFEDMDRDYTERDLEEQDRRGYTAHPQRKEEFRMWEEAASWPEDCGVSNAPGTAQNGAVRTSKPRDF
jgi:hypothetical protein